MSAARLALIERLANAKYTPGNRRQAERQAARSAYLASKDQAHTHQAATGCWVLAFPLPAEPFAPLLSRAS